MATKNADEAQVLAALAEVRKAAAALKRAEDQAEAKRADLAAKVAAAAKLGAKPTPLVQASGKSTETIRQWSREHGVGRRRPPTSGGFPRNGQTEVADS